MFRNLPTFKSLPQAIGLPFLSSSEDAQLAFKAGDNGLKRLSQVDVIPLSEASYWSQYWSVFNSAADVYSLLSVQDVRQALRSNPDNVANLIQALAHHLFTLLPSPEFPSSTPPETGGLSSTAQALNCLRVLGRVLVVVYEGEAEGTGKAWADKHLWSRGRAPLRSAVGGVDEGTQFSLGDDEVAKEEAPSFTAALDENELEHPLARSSTNGHDVAPEEEGEELPSLADRLFSCVIDMLFCAGFTVPDSVRGEDGQGDKINYVIWEKGVGSTVSIGSTSELDRNKVEVLRFLVILLSQTVYTSPTALATATNEPLEHLTHALERRLVLSLLCSLLNTSLTLKAGGVPYNHLVFRAAEERRTMVRMCLMTLLVALDYRSFDNIAPTPGTPGGPAAEKDDNAFRFFISKLHRKDDFAFVLGGIIGILEEHMAHTNNYLPGSKKPVPYLPEAFMLLWRLVDLNKRFRAYVFESGKAIDIIGYILICCLEFKNDPAQHGMLRLLAYLLQTLSADQGFATAINQPLRQPVPAKWAVQGNASDFMIVSIYSIATTPGLNTLFPALTISITNAAPHLRNIGVQASTRLMQLFKAFSAPNFLLADDSHPRLVYYLLETFNAVIYHQLNENPNLMYAILVAHADFQRLATFTLLSGLREIQRKKALRAKEEERNTPPPRGLVRTDSELAMLAEKAALLGREIDGDEIDDERSASHSQSHRGSEDSHARIASPTPGHMSEKARGKMRATSPPPDEGPAGDDDELMRVAAAGIGPSGYIPTQEWVTSWQKGLPLDPVLVAISELLPKIQDSQPRVAGPSSKVLNLLKEIDLTDVLPPAPPFVPRKFTWSPQSCVWLTSLLWGDIYVAGVATGVWRDTTVRLFGVKQAPGSKRAAQVDRVLKMFGVA
ncbi:hypothetical protein CspHIS471_0104880 [Cutaneotrichosporon sp. HIS471]|nr:hypothetical protein CspHIS471_0104880 [Cutaneotrichosporon sp. HIS471]